MSSFEGTLFAAIFGELGHHPWRDRTDTTSDAYSLFVARSSAMGWLAEAAENASGGVWGMNDGDQDADFECEPPRIAWFQVAVRGATSAGGPLPIQAFVACAADVLTRIGTPRVEAIHVLLPVQCNCGPREASARAGAEIALLESAGWFADPDPNLRAPVRIALDGGRDSFIRAVSTELLEWIQGFRQDVFSCDAVAMTDDDDLSLPPAVIDQLWLGSGREQAIFRGSLIEWSLDALGWLAAFFAEGSFQHGIDTPLMLTASRRTNRGR